MNKLRVERKTSAYIICVLLSFLSFLIFYIPNGFFYEDDALIYSSYFLRYIIDSFIPVFLAFIIFTNSRNEKLFKTFLSAVLLNLPRLAYTVPYYYLYYMSEGYDSYESLIFLSIRSALLVLIFSIEILIIARIAAITLRRTEKKYYSQYGRGGNFSFFDLSCPPVVAIFSISISRFAVNLINEIYYTVIYIIDYAGTYRTKEIYLIIIKFLFALLTLFVTHFLIILYAKRVMKSNERRTN